MLLEKLSKCIGPSGYEEEIREVIKEELYTFTDNVTVDRMGNVIVHSDGNDNSSPKIMIASHMDERGLIITSYNDDGTLKFSTLGKMEKDALPCKTVLIGNKKVHGVIGIKPIHLQDKSERDKNISYDDMCIDIGASSKDECRKIVLLGDFVVFDNSFSNFGDNLVKGKALDNRIGCSILLELLKEKYECNLYGMFYVQGNIDKRGIYTAAYNVKPDIMIDLDTINSTDGEGVPEYLKTNELTGGPVIPFNMEESIFNRDIVKSIRNKADNMGIAYKKSISTKDTSKLKPVRLPINNCKTAAVLIPCKHMDYNISMCSLMDYESTLTLVKSYLSDLSDDYLL